jgi:glycosyltransferase A (GT-A) superfamily protein (DUF2064 family)/8-oxo-dGTP pyrophosphatase MutT (NUDIX family)
MNKINENVVIILAKKPEEGKVKTRIAKDTSPKFALKLANACFKDLLKNLQNSNYYDLVVATDSKEQLAWFDRFYNLNGIAIEDEKSSAELGMKMVAIFKKVFKLYGYKKAVLIPMDLPFIQAEDIITAFSRLNDNTYALGPETNGGVYAIGLRSEGLIAKKFKGIPWSTPHSFDGLFENFGSDDTYKLKYKDDINTFQDILNNKDSIKMFCPHLHELLEAEGYYLPQSEYYIDYDTLNISIPTVSVIVERENKGKTEILIQTRHKPSIDPIYSGKIEIPSGVIERYELAKDTAIREVLEETGLHVEINGHYSEDPVIDGNQNDSVQAYNPFCVTQQIKGGRSYLNLGFICKERDITAKPVENLYETKNPRWISLKKLESMLKNKRDDIFILCLPVLEKYLAFKKNGKTK